MELINIPTVKQTIFLPELLEKYALFLDLKDLCNFARTNKLFSRVCSNDKFWGKRLDQDYQLTVPSNVNMSCRDYYREVRKLERKVVIDRTEHRCIFENKQQELDCTVYYTDLRPPYKIYNSILEEYNIAGTMYIVLSNDELKTYTVFRRTRFDPGFDSDLEDFGVIDKCVDMTEEQVLDLIKNFTGENSICYVQLNILPEELEYYERLGLVKLDEEKDYEDEDD